MLPKDYDGDFHYEDCNVINIVCYDLGSDVVNKAGLVYGVAFTELESPNVSLIALAHWRCKGSRDHEFF